jgi:hypothetical protein
MSPRFDDVRPVPLDDALLALLPEQGSFELQHDQPGKTHNWHEHTLDEELFVLSGDVLLFWAGDGGYEQRACPAGTWITLPARTVHGSVAGAGGAVYMIRPEGGRTAQTRFLDEAEFPYPTPAGAVETVG